MGVKLRGRWRRRSRGLAVLVWPLGALALACRPAVGGPPVVCPPMHEAQLETMCPPCETLADPPPGYCPCTRGWVCRPTAALDRAMTREREEAARREADARQRAAQEAQEAEARRRPSQGLTPTRPEPERPHLPRVREIPGCAVPCANGGDRLVALRCTEGGVRRSEIEARCDGQENVSEFGCAEPWRVLGLRCSAVVPPSPPRGVCPARQGQCCLEDGQVVTPCGPGPTPPGAERRCRPMLCGSGDFCSGCR
jgi:hypothetical protein